MKETISQLKETNSTRQKQISELEGEVAERDGVIDQLMETVDGLKAKGFELNVKLRSEKSANYQLMKKQQDLNDAVSKTKEPVPEKNVPQKEIPQASRELPKDDQNLIDSSVKAPELKPSNEPDSSTKIKSSAKNKHLSKLKTNEKVIARRSSVSTNSKTASTPKDKSPPKSDKTKNQSFFAESSELPDHKDYRLKRFASTSIVETENEIQIQTANKGTNTVQTFTSNVGSQTQHYDDLAYEQVDNLRRSGVTEQEIIDTLSRILERNRLAEITGVKARVNTKKREAELKMPTFTLSSEDKDDSRKNTERATEPIKSYFLGQESGLKIELISEVEKMFSPEEKGKNNDRSEIMRLEQRGVPINTREPSSNQESNQKFQAPKKPSHQRYNLSLDSRAQQTMSRISNDLTQNPNQKKNKINNVSSSRNEIAITTSPKQLAGGMTQYKMNYTPSPSPGNTTPMVSKPNSSTTLVSSPNNHRGKNSSSILDGHLSLNTGSNHSPVMISNSPTPSLLVHSPTADRADIFKNLNSPSQIVSNNTSPRFFAHKGSAKPQGVYSATNLMRTTAVNSNLTTSNFEGETDSPRMTSRRTVAHLYMNNEGEVGNKVELAKKRKMLLSTELEEPDLEHQNEALLAQMFEVMKEKAKNVPKIKRIFKPFAPSQLKPHKSDTERSQEAPEDEDDGDDDFEVDFEVFKEYYKRMQKIHRKCGEDCIHLRRFYNKIGWHGSYNDRPFFTLKKNDIDKLPRIIRKVFV